MASYTIFSVISVTVLYSNTFIKVKMGIDVKKNWVNKSIKHGTWLGERLRS